MRIILEGCDGVGKTTLAKLLADKYHLDICHCSQDDPNDYLFYKETIRKNNVVWDRHTIGELVYPEIFGRIPNLNIEDVRLIIAYARELGTKIFVLTNNIEDIRDRLLERQNEDHKILDKLEWINNRFLTYAEIYHIPVIDTSKMTIKEIFDLVNENEKTYEIIRKEKYHG